MLLKLITKLREYFLNVQKSGNHVPLYNHVSLEIVFQKITGWENVSNALHVYLSPWDFFSLGMQIFQ